MPSSLLDSAVFRDIFTTPAMRNVFSDENRVQKYLDFEAALARAQAKLKIIPQEACDEIVKHCTADKFDMAKLKADYLQLYYSGRFRPLNHWLLAQTPRLYRWGAPFAPVVNWVQERGLVRWFLSNHVTYAINSIGHYFGRRRFATSDESRNVSWLALISFGEAWHNFHHAFPRSARHGALAHQIDPAAAVIRLFERAGWATEVRWPTAAQLAICRSD